MSNMKHLMLFEAFESNALSKMMAFLAKKTDSNSKERFKDKLKRLITQFDIPIDKISDTDVKYLNRNKALKLKNVDKVENDKGIYCLKFWFSMDEGYLGFTGTGNVTMDFNRYISGSRRRSSSDKNSPFTTRELDYIKNRLDIKTGSLEPVKNYENIQHGQLVMGIFSDDEDDLSRLGVAKIWRDENHLYAIQDITSGGSPENEINGVSWRDWGYRSSWSLDSVYSPGSDHCKLHIYTPSDEPIYIVGAKEEVEEVEIKSPLDFNLPLNSSYGLREWGDTSWSIDDYTLVEKSDFSIILMLDDILKSVKTSVNKTKANREESREGATKLMSDSQIKKANIERYLTAIVGKMGIDRDIKELQNLQKLVIKSVCGDLAFISIYKGRPGFDSLDSMSGYIYDMMRSDGNDKDYYLSSIISSFKSLNSYSEEYTKQYNESLKEVNNSDIEPLKEIFKIFIEIGKKIKNYLLSQNIQTIEDLGMVMVKLRSIRNLTGERGFSLSYTRNILNEFHYTNDVKYYINECNSERRKNEVLEDIKKAKHIERYIDSLLR